VTGASVTTGTEHRARIELAAVDAPETTRACAVVRQRGGRGGLTVRTHGTLTRVETGVRWTNVILGRYWYCSCISHHNDDSIQCYSSIKQELITT